MAARLEQNAKRRAEKKTAPVGESTSPRSLKELLIRKAKLDAVLTWRAPPWDPPELQDAWEAWGVAWYPSEAPNMVLCDLRWDQAELLGASEARGAALWDEAVESLGRSAGVLAELAESTGEAIARISARGDRIDRIQKETRALLNALVASEADA